MGIEKAERSFFAGAQSPFIEFFAQQQKDYDYLLENVLAPEKSDKGSGIAALAKLATPQSDELPSTAVNKSGVIAASLQRVGGGGAFSKFSDSANPAAQAVQEQKTTNKLLLRTNALLAGQSGSGGGPVLAY